MKRAWHGFFYLIALIFILLPVLAVFLTRPIQGDEANSFIRYVNGGIDLGGIAGVYAPNNHVFYNLMAHFACLVFGDGVWVARLPSLIAGVAAIFAVYVLSRRLYHSPRLSFLAAVFLFSSPLFLHYCTAGRGYAWFVLLVIVSFYCLVRLLESGRLRWRIGYILFSALGLYVIPVMVYAVLSGIVWYIFISKKRSDKNSYQDAAGLFLGVVFLACLFYLPVLLRFGLSTLLNNPFVEQKSFSATIFSLFKLPWSLAQQWFWDLPWFVSLFLFIGFVYGFAFCFLCQKRIIAIYGAIIFSVAVVTIIVGKVPYERCFIFILPFCCIVSAYGWVRLLPKKWVYFFGIIFFGISQYYAINSSWAMLDEFRGGPQAMNVISLRMRPGDLILATAPGDAIIPYYFSIHNIDMRYFVNNPTRARRIFVVTKNVESSGRDFIYTIFKNHEGKEPERFIVDDVVVYVFGV